MKAMVKTSIFILLCLIIQAGLVVVREDMATGSTNVFSPDVAEDVERQIKKLQSKNPYTRVRAADALGDMGYHAALALGNLALAGINANNAAPSLIQALHDEDEQVRTFAARSLNYIGDPQAVEPLIHALRDEDMGVRADAASALGKLKDKRAIVPLLEMLKEKKRNYQCAAEALREITGQSFGDDLRKWQAFFEETNLDNDR